MLLESSSTFLALLIKKYIITFKFVPWDDLPSEMFCVFHSNSNKGVVGCVAAREYEQLLPKTYFLDDNLMEINFFFLLLFRFN